MKGLFLIILTFFICLTNIYSADYEKLFQEANEKYKQKEYYEAIDLYEKILDNGLKSAEVYYNLGNSYFKTENYPKAILNYERAKVLDPVNKDIDFNLAKSRTYIVDKIDAIPELFIKSWIKKLLSILSSDTWALISVVLFITALVLFMLYFFARKSNIKKPAFIFGVLLIAVSLITFLSALKTKSYIEKSDTAIILEQMVRVKSSPDNESTDMFIIHEGTKVYIIREVDNWSEIKLADGKQGWVKTADFEEI